MLQKKLMARNVGQCRYRPTYLGTYTYLGTLLKVEKLKVGRCRVPIIIGNLKKEQVHYSSKN